MKVILKNSKGFVYCKKILNNEIFFSREREKDEKISLNELEKNVKKKIREDYKINLL